MKNMKKILALLLSVIFIFSLAACGDKPSGNEENQNQEEQQIEHKSGEDEKKSEEKKEDKNKPKEYDPTAWIKDNTSISFYLLYVEEKPETNELMTFKILGDKAVLYSKKGDEEEKPITIYEETDEGIVLTQLLHIYDQKAAIVGLPKTDYHELKEFLPKVGSVAGIFGARAERDIYKNREITGSAEYLGRKCDVFEKNSGVVVQTAYLDKETGIIMKNETVTKTNDKEVRQISSYVTEFEYGTVTEDDVTIDLSEYKVTYEEAEENTENKEDDAE